TLGDFCEAVVNRSRDAWFPERLAERIHQTRAVGIRCLSLSLADELHDLTASACRARSEVVIEYLGWDGEGQRSLESVGKHCGLSKERVRQLVVDFAARLSKGRAWTPVLRRAMDACS